MVRVMMTPLALKLVGAKLLPVEIETKDLHKILYGKHAGDMDFSIMRQLPRALADPVMIFNSYNGRNREHRKVVVVSLKDNNGATIIVPMELEVIKLSGGYKINRVTSAYGKTDWTTGEASNQCFIKQLEAGMLEYVNRKKANDWISSEKPYWPMPKEKINSLFSAFNVTNETDLVKLKNRYPNFYQMAGERANAVMISRLQKAESMEREAASSEEIWMEPGWMRGPDHKSQVEI